MKITDVETLGRIIKEERKLQNLTQEELAMASNVGLRFVVDIEKGKETCQIAKVFNILLALGISIEIKTTGNNNDI